MENASKALLIAAEVLIGIMLLSLAVYVYTTFANIAKDINSQTEVLEVATYNSKFEALTIDDENNFNLDVYQVIDAYNTVVKNNLDKVIDTSTQTLFETVIDIKKYNGSDNYTNLGKINFDSGPELEKSLSESQLAELIATNLEIDEAKANSKMLKYGFKVENIVYNNENGRVKKIVFERGEMQ